jgi:hypothetical protein
VVRVSARPSDHSEDPRLADEVLAALSQVTGDGQPVPSSKDGGAGSDAGTDELQPPSREVELLSAPSAVSSHPISGE